MKMFSMYYARFINLSSLKSKVLNNFSKIGLNFGKVDTIGDLLFAADAWRVRLAERLDMLDLLVRLSLGC